MSGYLTTHILDTANGTPAEGVAIELCKINGVSREVIATTVTNSDGRTDSPILPADEFKTGTYELVFKIGDYLRSNANDGTKYADPLFLDEIPIRFGMSEESHYHVPLLISPFGYSTYRGS